jgi:hypothetical protein
LSALVEIENKAGIARVTAGWKKPELALDAVFRYWRDVHSPSIARRPGIYDYRHFQYGPVHSGLFDPVPGIGFACPAEQQLMWTSDVRYLDETGLAAFSASPEPAVRALILGDIDLIVDQSTTYKSLGADARTLIDRTGIAMPQGTPRHPTFQLFVRRRSDDAAFRTAMTALAEHLSSLPGVLRLRLSLLEAPDMQAERAAGYPIKTHPVEHQYQAWIDLVVEDPGSARPLLGAVPDLAHHVREIHAYPVTTLCTFNYAGRLTLPALRGWPAYDALTTLGARHQAEPALLHWMYGAVAEGVTLEAPR